MARKPTKLSDERIEAMTSAMIADADSYDSSERKTRREYSLRYMAGEMPDLVANEGFSQVVSHDISDAKSQLLPSLMRVFLSSDRIGVYQPEKPGDEDFADQATDYANFIFFRECNGEMLMRDVLDDGLGLGNGIVKHWWDDTEEHRVETLSGLSDDDFVELVSGDDVEVLEHSEYADEGAQGAGVVPGLPVGMAAPTAPTQPVGPTPDTGAAIGASAGMGPVQAPPPGAMAPPAMAVGTPPVLDAAPGLQAGQPGTDAAANALQQLGIGGNFPPPPMLHDVKIRRLVRKGRLRIVAVPDEDFGIESAATGLNERECRFCYHRETPTRSELIERGYDKDIVFDLPTVGESVDSDTRRTDYAGGTKPSDDYEDKAGERVEVCECYAKIDVDGDGITEWHQIVMGGSSGSHKLLRQTEWGGMLPFTDIVPDPIPHVWRGRSLYDQLRDVQRVKTVLWRKTLDNVYQVVEPGRAADMTRVKNPDAVFNRALGQVIQTNGDPRGIIVDDVVASIAQFSMPLIGEMDKVAERRVGVGEQSSGLDPDALQGQVATAVAATQSASNLRKEDYARNIQMGVRRLFSAILRIIVEHQDKERTIRLRDKWVPMDPRSWNADMDVTVNVGLGAGNRDRDLAMLQGIAGKQEQVLQILGPKNPWIGLKNLANTYQKMTEAAGVKSPEQFFPDFTDEMAQAMEAAQAQAAQQPDPKAMAAQAQLQIAQQKAQNDAQIAQGRAQAEMALQQAKAQAEAQLSAAKMQQQQAIAEAKLQADMRVREAEAQHTMDLDRAKAQTRTMELQLKAQMDAQIAQAKADAQLEIERVKATAQMQLKERELAMEFALKQQTNAMGLNRGTNLEYPA